MKIERATQGRAVLRHLKICKSNMGILFEALMEMTENAEGHEHEVEDMETFERILRDFFTQLQKWLTENPPRVEPGIIKPMQDVSALGQLEAMIAKATKAGLIPTKSSRLDVN